MPERIAPEPLQKVITKFCEIARHVWVDLKLKSRTSYVTSFEVIYTNWHQILVLSQTFYYWDKQQFAGSNIIQFYVTLK